MIVKVKLSHYIYLLSLKNFGVLHDGDDDAGHHSKDSRAKRCIWAKDLLRKTGPFAPQEISDHMPL